jgi:hypothetical protein
MVRLLLLGLAAFSSAVLFFLGALPYRAFRAFAVYTRRQQASSFSAVFNQ